MFRFENTEYLWLLWIVVALVLLFIIYSYIRKKKLLKFGEINLISKLMPETSSTRKLIKFLIGCLALTFMILALARPQIGTKYKEVTTQGIELAIVIDVSNSMLAEDIKPNRLQNTKTFVQRVLRRLQGDKVALIVFAGEAFVQMPLTDDLNAARMFMSTINTDIVPIQGTAIGRAIDLATNSFSSEEDLSRVILLITDGEDHEDDPVLSAKNAADRGMIVHAVGMGLPGGSPIPLQGRSGFMRDREGNVVTTALDEKTLMELADAGNGIYVRASNNPNSLDIIIEEIDKLKKGEITQTKYSEYEDRFQFFLFWAILLIILNVFISEKKNKYLSNINLFKSKDIN